MSLLYIVPLTTLARGLGDAANEADESSGADGGVESEPPEVGETRNGAPSIAMHMGEKKLFKLVLVLRCGPTAVVANAISNNNQPDSERLYLRPQWKRRNTLVWGKCCTAALQHCSKKV